MARYLIGIDFGTTNCSVSYRDLAGEPEALLQFFIPQATAPGMIESLPLLPSCLYFPTDEERKNGLNLGLEQRWTIGGYAYSRAAEVPFRSISSAKSWLCHAGIDRRASLLPIGGEASFLMSPLDACSALFLHIKEAWDSIMEAPFAEQELSITVPASFDPSARQFVEEAAQRAGYPKVVLLEEPQAAFYAWLHSHSELWRKQLSLGDQILVIDIGGGTTDFTAIRVADEAGTLGLERYAVGAHLLLGGDNFDHALADLAREKFEEKGVIVDEWQFQSLVHSCRRGKELLFCDPKAKAIDVAVMGRGSRLVGGVIKLQIKRDEALKLLLDGFFPLVSPQEQSPLERSLGLKQVGLPYARDPCVTRQLAKFLSQTGEGGEGGLDHFIIPRAVLFNGGSLKGDLLRERLLEQLNSWAAHFGKPQVIELEGADYDCAVSRGAVYCAMARKGSGLRIKAGTSRSYYIGIEEAAPAIPGREPPMKAICIAPKGMEEGSEALLQGQQFALVLGQEVSFRFFSHATVALSDGTIPVIGTWVRQWRSELTELHPLEIFLPKGQEDGKVVCVELKSKVTDVGSLELWCQAPDGRQWKLEFDTRHDRYGA